MKKIIATVLAMVMALALCSTAFAAPIKVDAKAADKTTQGWDIYYVEKDASGTITKYCDKNGTTLNDNTVAVIMAGGFYKISLTQVDVKAAATCTKDGREFNAYVGNDNMYYAKYDDVDDAGKATGATTVFIGTSFGDAVKYVKYATKAALDAANKAEAGHYLYETADVYGTSKATVYKCAVCGGTYVKVGEISTSADKTAVSALSKIDYTVPTDVATVLAKAGVNPSDQAAAGTYYVQTAGKTPAASGSKPSPKTFDAGIALYAAMALTSVAGSAVVIGKKKEF